MNGDQLIKQFRKAFNRESTCPESCGNACCHQPVLMTYTEWQQLTHPLKLETPQSGVCQFLSDAQCQIYQDRPVPCRWHGLSDAGENHCDLITANPLSEAHVEDLRRRWTLLLYKQMGQVMTGKRRNQEALAWLGYCASIPAGRKIAQKIKEALRTH